MRVALPWLLMLSITPMLVIGMVMASVSSILLEVFLASIVGSAIIGGVIVARIVRMASGRGE